MKLELILLVVLPSTFSNVIPEAKGLVGNVIPAKKLVANVIPAKNQVADVIPEEAGLIINLTIYDVYYRCPCEAGLKCETDRTIIGSITNTDFGLCIDPNGRSLSQRQPANVPEKA